MKNGLCETKEELIRFISKPTPPVEVHLNCNFCMNNHTDKCIDSPTADSCSMYKENKNISFSDKIIMLIEAETPVFFKDQLRIPRIWINDNGKYKNFKLDSTNFKQYAIDKFFRTFGKTPKRESVKDAIRALEALTRNAKTINVRNRITMIKTENGEDKIWVDLCDAWHRSIKITKSCYELVEKTPPIFSRFEHMETLCLPQKDDTDDTDDSSQDSCTPHPCNKEYVKEEGGGGIKSCEQSSLPSSPSFSYIWRIFDYLRIPKEDQILIISAIVSYFFVNAPFVVVSVIGASGRGKSTGVKVVKKLLDPSSTVILAIEKNRDQLLQDMDHHFFCAYDNVSYISNEYSDIFCRCATGYGIAKRLLYSNDADFLRQLKRPIWFNGIPLAITREDLLKRTILTEVTSLIGKERTEDEIYAEFDKIKPYILHELYTLVSQVMAKLPKMKPKTLFRMADYTRIGCCVAEALGKKQGVFIEAYRNKQNEQIKEVIWNNTLGNVLFDFIEDKHEWIGSPSDLYKLVHKQAKELGVSTRIKEFPKAPNKMSQEINRLKESFEKLGINFVFIKGTTRKWYIVNTNYKDTEKPDDPKTESEKLEEVRNWILTNRKDGVISSSALTAKIKELGFDPKIINTKLLREGTIFVIQTSGAWGVNV